jgi:hypothetical protein
MVVGWMGCLDASLGVETGDREDYLDHEKRGQSTPDHQE